MIEDKLLNRHWYRNTPLPKINNKRNIDVFTGSGGAKMLIEEYRRKGISDDIIETFIEVLTDNYGWQPLSILNIKNVKNEL